MFIRWYCEESKFCFSSGSSFSFSGHRCLVAGLAVAGNALVLAAIWRDPSLRTPSYIILSGLAFTDLCTGLVTQPFHVTIEVMCQVQRKAAENSRLSYLFYATKLTAGCGTFFTSLTLTLITLMSIERWLHTTRRSLLTMRRGCFIVALASLSSYSSCGNSPNEVSICL